MKSVFSWNQNMFLCISFLCRRYCSEQHPTPDSFDFFGAFSILPRGFLFISPANPHFLSLVLYCGKLEVLLQFLFSPLQLPYVCLLGGVCFLCVGGFIHMCEFGKRKCKSEMDYTGHRSREGLCGEK